jgi:hypothetical protein
MHPGPAGCIGCIIGGPGERCPADAAAATDAPGLRIIGHVTRLTWQPAALVAPHASCARRHTSPQPPARPSATPAHRRAAMPRDVAGTHRSRRPVEAPDLALLHNPGDPYGNHQPGSSLQGSPLRLRYSAWLVIRSLPVSAISATPSPARTPGTPIAAVTPAPPPPTSAPPQRSRHRPVRADRRAAPARHAAGGTGVVATAHSTDAWRAATSRLGRDGPVPGTVAEAAATSRLGRDDPVPGTVAEAAAKRSAPVPARARTLRSWPLLVLAAPAPRGP